MMLARFFSLLFLLPLFVACTPSLLPEGGGLRYAQFLRMDEREGHTLATILSPWDSTQTLATYALLPRSASATDSAALAQQGLQVLRVPLHRVLPTSAVHAALAIELGAQASLAGLCDTAWVVSQKVKAAQLPSFGSSMQPDAERIVAARLDALLYSPYEGGRQELLEALGLPLVPCADYLETTPLGRAEWMRFYGRLWGKAEVADSLFQVEEQAYLQWREQAQSRITHRPTLLVDKREGSAWYVPAGQSYLARLYADAGARYLFASLPGTGSTALDVERVLSEAKNAEVWVIKYARVPPLTLTRQRLLEDHAIYGRFRAFSKGRMYGCNTLAVPYYEELPFHPSRLLREWLALLHPGLLPEQQNKYFLPLP